MPHISLRWTSGTIGTGADSLLRAPSMLHREISDPGTPSNAFNHLGPKGWRTAIGLDRTASESNRALPSDLIWNSLALALLFSPCTRSPLERSTCMSAKAPPSGCLPPAGSEIPQDKSGIVVVDDHPIVREGLVRVIEQTPDLAVCGQAEGIPQALALIEKSQPALVIVDIALGGQNGIELIKDIKIRLPNLPVLVHSMYDESLYAERCLRAGAKGYVMKQEPPTTLLKAVRQILAGAVYLSEPMTKQLLWRIADGGPGKGSSPAELLSDRELEVFELLGRGYRTQEIANELHLSDKTIQTHREHIKEKLNIPDAVNLVRQAVRWVEAQK